ncbi:MAG: hypothetical protein M4579_007704, partial [Chaenotheca gracillima]
MFEDWGIGKEMWEEADWIIWEVSVLVESQRGHHKTQYIVDQKPSAEQLSLLVEESRLGDDLLRLLHRWSAAALTATDVAFAALNHSTTLAGEILEDATKSPGHSMTALPKREDSDARRAEEQPQDADADPAGEEGLAEDVAGTVEGHGPEY